jgi:hypothetical protein
LFLKHPAEEKQQITFDVDLSHIEDFSYGDLHQAWVVVV